MAPAINRQRGLQNYILTLLEEIEQTQRDKASNLLEEVEQLEA